MKDMKHHWKGRKGHFYLSWARFWPSSMIGECLIVSLPIEYELFCLAFAAVNVYVGCGICWYTCSCLILRINFIWKVKHAYLEHLNEWYQLFFSNIILQVNQKTEARHILSIVQKLFSTKLCKFPATVRW